MLKSDNNPTSGHTDFYVKPQVGDIHRTFVFYMQVYSMLIAEKILEFVPLLYSFRLIGVLSSESVCLSKILSLRVDVYSFDFVIVMDIKSTFKKADWSTEVNKPCGWPPLSPDVAKKRVTGFLIFVWIDIVCACELFVVEMVQARL